MKKEESRISHRVVVQSYECSTGKTTVFRKYFLGQTLIGW